MPIGAARLPIDYSISILILQLQYCHRARLLLFQLPLTCAALTAAVIAPLPQPAMKLTFRTINGTNFHVECEPDTPVGELKAKVEASQVSNTMPALNTYCYFSRCCCLDCSAAMQSGSAIGCKAHPYLRIVSQEALQSQNRRQLLTPQHLIVPIAEAVPRKPRHRFPQWRPMFPPALLIHLYHNM